MVIFSISGRQIRKNAVVEEATVDHLLFRCSRWSILREEHKIKRLAKGRWGDTAYLLGGWSGERKDGALQSWKPNLKVVKATIKFVEATERLDRIIDGDKGRRTRRKATEEKKRAGKVKSRRVRGKGPYRGEEGKWIREGREGGPSGVGFFC